MQKDHLNLEQIAQMLNGKSISQVRYYDIPYDNDLPENYRHHNFDWIHFGIELEMTDGNIFSIIWDQKSTQYGLSLYHKSLSHFISTYTVWNVSSTSRWSDVLKTPIVSAETCWALGWANDSDKKSLCPYAIQINFASKHTLFIVAATYFQERGDIFLMADSVIVIFDKNTAEKYGVCFCTDNDSQN